jgi:hypothetical protein
MQLLLMHSEIVIAPIWRDKNMMLAVGKWFAIS